MITSIMLLSRAVNGDKIISRRPDSVEKKLLRNIEIADIRRRVEEREKSVGVSGWERGELVTTNGERGVTRSSNIRAVRFTDYPSPALFVNLFSACL